MSMLKAIKSLKKVEEPKGRKRNSVFIYEEVWDAFEKLCKREGVSLSKTLEQAMIDAVKEDAENRAKGRG